MLALSVIGFLTDTLFQDESLRLKNYKRLQSIVLTIEILRIHRMRTEILTKQYDLNIFLKVVYYV